MAAPESTTLDRLRTSPYAFEFFQAVRLLERAFPDRAPVGRLADPATEVVRFHAHNSLSFPASELFALTLPSQASASPADMWVTFMGLTGPQGVMPLHYTQLLAYGDAERDAEPLAAFFDIFNHRFLSLFYRAWEKSRFPIEYERGTADRFTRCLLSVVGLGESALQNRLAVNDHALLFYSGLLAQRPRSAAALEHLLEDYFEVPVRVQQFTGEWFFLNPDTLTALGDSNCELGVSTALWDEVFDPPARFRVHVGPLGYDQFRTFLPDGANYTRMVDLTRFFVGDEFGFEVQPMLERDEVRSCALSADGQHLGWGMWLHPADDGEALVQPLFEARVAHRPDGDVATL